jgi:hypothetical protein
MAEWPSISGQDLNSTPSESILEQTGLIGEGYDVQWWNATSSNVYPLQVWAPSGLSSAPLLVRGSAATLNSYQNYAILGGTTSYLYTQTLPSVSMAGTWSAMIAFEATGASGTVWSLASTADDTNNITLTYDGSGKVKLNSGGSSSSDLTVPIGSFICVFITSNGTSITATRMDNSTSVSVANAGPTGSTVRAGLGVQSGASLNAVVDALRPTFMAVWTGAVSAMATDYAWLKAVKAADPNNPLTIL